jgi:hypothetical protein
MVAVILPKIKGRNLIPHITLAMPWKAFKYPFFALPRVM